MNAKTYKTELSAKSQAARLHGKNWAENWVIVPSGDQFAIAAKQAEEKLEESDSQIESEELPTNSAPSMLSGLIGNMLNPESVPQAPKVEAPKKQAEKTGKTVEQNRPEQNGLKRPSAGSTCAIIWDTCDRITSETKHTCTSAELFNALQGYNECTLRTQYARWRQFNGITGRLPNQQKQTKLPAEWQDAIDSLRVRIADDKVDAIKALEACKSPTDLVAWIAHNSVNF